jgi:o-succinylbenzoate synthase
MYRIAFAPYTLHFKFDAGTSRGVMREHNIWYVQVQHVESGLIGYGEVAPLPGLSEELDSSFEHQLHTILVRLGKNMPSHFTFGEIPHILQRCVPQHYPSVRFGVETALTQLAANGSFDLYGHAFARAAYGIPINGLVWMGSKDHMQTQANSKPEQGFTCVKMKIGAIRWEDEKAILTSLRQQYSKEQLIIRVDANGSLEEQNAHEILTELQALDIHSIEQPFAKGNHTLTKRFINEQIIPIALDEELLGHFGASKQILIDKLRPPFIVLKPGLLGGAAAIQEWIEIASSYGLGWWITSALESNVGLNAIAQFTATLQPSMHQGLGTGSLYHNNISSPLTVENGLLWYKPMQSWNTTQLDALGWVQVT